MCRVTDKPAAALFLRFHFRCHRVKPAGKVRQLMRPDRQSDAGGILPGGQFGAGGVELTNWLQKRTCPEDADSGNHEQDHQPGQARRPGGASDKQRRQGIPPIFNHAADEQKRPSSARELQGNTVGRGKIGRYFGGGDLRVKQARLRFASTMRIGRSKRWGIVCCDR